MPTLRFKIHWDKCLEGIHLLAARQAGITTFYVSKVFFFADKKHLLDWGRPISGDRYIAMENGPVPSNIYDLIKQNEYLADDLLDEFERRIEKRGRHLYSRVDFVARALSPTDVAYLEDARATYSQMGFGALSRLTHSEKAWEEAWDRPGISNEMDPALLIADDAENRDSLIDEIKQKSAYAA